jgi:hypothetical protein
VAIIWSDEAFFLSVTTVPEQQTYALMLVGLGRVGFGIRCGRSTNA